LDSSTNTLKARTGLTPTLGNPFDCFDQGMLFDDLIPFTLLAMGFNGPKALKFKVKYIEVFNAMEAELLKRRTGTPAIDLHDPKQLAAVKAQLDALVQDNTQTTEQDMVA
jgi:hypothetical protein